MLPKIKLYLQIPEEAIDRDGGPFTSVSTIVYHEEDMEQVYLEKGGRSGIQIPNKLGGCGYLKVTIKLPLSDEQYDAIDCIELT